MTEVELARRARRLARKLDELARAAGAEPDAQSFIGIGDGVFVAQIGSHNINQGRLEAAKTRTEVRNGKQPVNVN